MSDKIDTKLLLRECRHIRHIEQINQYNYNLVYLPKVTLHITQNIDSFFSGVTLSLRLTLPK
jgi:hypothetical protein